MQKKLQELTEKIYQEGVDKANQEAEKIISDAKAEAKKDAGPGPKRGGKQNRESGKRVGRLKKERHERTEAFGTPGDV